MGNVASNMKTPSTRLEKEIAVLKATTKLSEKQIREMYEEFDQEAESGTGRMNKRQFSKFYKHVTGFEDKNGSLADKAFAVFDINDSGSIDFSEFVLASTVGYKIDLDSQLELAFSL
ncbi:unnamed protein product [Rotaria sp. Silwood1]|nr:unnamed protein product [Rotaria sp. Silwood1]CAF1668820.1 unnamed protein product [Rotaria sp. Silwood1]CAF3852746.1 unnamed protein product [Rotaria sp. Silwood1]CAF3864155.1 unnamed protein product [Rotaria sp. Silwood1]CAF3994237.1 unnamed protein product [Rotaria sp. Silwood1]